MNHLDFETFSEANLRVVGTYRYAEDPTTQPLCLSFADDRGPVHGESLYGVTHISQTSDAVKRFASEVERGELIGAHNAEFERAIWERKLVPMGFPPTRVEQWRCTAVRAAAAGFPRKLDNAIRARGLDVAKDKRGDRLLKMFAGLQPRGKGRILPTDAPEAFAELIEYCRGDTVGERELDHALPPLSGSEWTMYGLTMSMNERGLPLDLEMVRTAQRVLAVIEERIHERVIELTGGLAPTQVGALLEFLNGDTDAELLSLQAKELKDRLAGKGAKLDPRAAEVIQLRLEASRVSTKKLARMLQVVCADGRARGMFLFYGAHTGRYSGRLIQPQNFPRGELKPHQFYAVFDALMLGDADALALLYEKPLTTLSFVMRGFIAAIAGRRFVVGDYSAIEARVLNWLAGQSDVVAAYFRGEDLYKVMASIVFQIPISQVDSEQRRIAKQIVLGCGYGMGYAKFVDYCEKQDIYISLDFAKTAVYAYRAKHDRVVALWGDVERYAIEAVRSGRSLRLGRLGFFVEGIFFCIRLPSGRLLRYPYPELGVKQLYGENKVQLSFMTEWHGRWVRETTYGGKLVENIVQGIAYDLMAHGMLAAEAADYPTVGTVHDELIAEMMNGVGSHKEYERVISAPPPWADGCPVGAEGFESVRYRKG